MVRIARADGYALDDVGGGIKLRRLVKAGQVVPDHFELQEEDMPAPQYQDHQIADGVEEVELGPDVKIQRNSSSKTQAAVEAQEAEQEAVAKEAEPTVHPTQAEKGK